VIAGAAAGVAAALPWWAAVAVFHARWRGETPLDDFAPAPLPPVPRLSVIVPARNEARVIARCVRSILASDYPALDVIVVDDDSSDGTADIARTAAAGDRRLGVVRPPPLPAGWFGKQWACWHGARAANGAVLCFTDADTVHGPELYGRCVRAVQERELAMLSVLGAQELESFWERVVQPQVFALLFARYGGTKTINRSRRATAKIAAGQCIVMPRAVYDEIGGHEAVHDRAAEDLALAQLLFRRGKRTLLVTGVRHLSVRMYTSLREIWGGWTKNVFAGGKEALPLPFARGAALAMLLPLPPLLTLVPLVAMLFAAVGAAPAWLGIAGALATLAAVLWFVEVYRYTGVPLRYVPTFPLGAVVLLAITVAAIVRGNRVRWKDRSYVAR
jgi:chlorobactene glucosyltransferase